MKSERSHHDIPSRFLISRAVPQYRKRGHYKAEDRNQDAPALDTAHDTKHSISGVFQRAEAVRVKLGHTDAIENLLAHLPTPAFQVMRSQQIPLFCFAQITSPSLCRVVNNNFKPVAKFQHNFAEKCPVPIHGTQT